MSAELREPEEDRTLVIDDAGTMSLHLPCNLIGVVIGPSHPHPRSADCVALCDDVAHHMVRCDDVAGHAGPHRARYHSGIGWPVGYFTDTLEAPTSSSEMGASASEPQASQPEPAEQTIPAPTDVPGLVLAAGFAFGTAAGLLVAAAFALSMGVI